MPTPFIPALAIALSVMTVPTALAGTAVADPDTRTVAAAHPSAAATVTAAKAAAFAHAAATGLGSRSKLIATAVMVDSDGKQHVRFTQTYRGLPVVGADLVIHLSAASQYLGVTRSTGQQVSLSSVAPALSAGQAQVRAIGAVRDGAAQSTTLIVHSDNGKSTLAYQVAVSGPNHSPVGARTLTVDAATGAVINNVPAFDEFLSPQVLSTLRARGERPSATSDSADSAAPQQSVKPSAFPSPATGTGRSEYSGTVTLKTTQTATNSFKLVDTTRGNAEIRDAKHSSRMDSRIFTAASVLTDSDNAWGNGSPSNNATAAVDAEHGITSTFDFYKSTFNRNGINNDGVGPHGVVHFSTNYGNAGWFDVCSCMVYGDGDGSLITTPLTQLDVTGHELTHGVVEATAGLESQIDPSTQDQIGEPGSLNESLADIFGSAVEFATPNPQNPANYLIGEQLGISQGFLRRLDHPSLDKLEGTVDYWSSSAPRTEVHAGSGVSSHAFYLLAEGSGSKTINGVSYNSPTFNGSTLTGIGRDAAIRIFYQALTRYMVPTTNFHDARTATLQAAADLFGQGSTQYNAVNAAWAAVNVTATN